MKRLRSIISRFEKMRQSYTADDVVLAFRQTSDQHTLFNFMQRVITGLQQMDKLRTCETYRVTLRSFMQFRGGNDLLLEELDSDILLMYESYLRNKGLARNTTSYYMRIFRAVYNRAVEKD